MVIMRFEPGQPVPFTGTYAIVGHYGEPTNVAVWCERGGTFPLITVTADFGPFWFVLVDEANEDARVA